MDRREFLKNALGFGIAAGASMLLGKTGGLFGEEKLSNATNPKAAFDLIAVRNGEPAALFDAAMKEMGGMGRFVKKGQTVVLKPNIGWAVEPERAATTNPKLVSQIIRHCLDAGAKEVVVFDHTCDNALSCYTKSGIQDAVKSAGGKMASGSLSGNYQKVVIPGAKILKSAMVHELLLSADIFINAPILKNHSSAGITVGMKNLMGVVWDRGYWHMNNLHQCIAEFAAWRKPDLTILDAYNVLRTNGPRGVSLSDVETQKSLVMGTDIVAVDAAGAKMLGKNPENVPFIRLASDNGLGRMDLANLNIKRMTL